jgi:hypothetical protein
MTCQRDLAVYVYGIALASDALAIDPFNEEGIVPDSFVRTVLSGPFTVVLSNVPRADFDSSDPAHRTNDPAWMAERVCAHHRVDQAARRIGPYLPLGFGTIFSNLARARQFLAQSQRQLLAALSDMEGHAEWALHLDIDDSSHETFLRQHDTRLQKLILAATTAREGTGFLLQRQCEKSQAAARVTHIELVTNCVAQALDQAQVRAPRQTRHSPPAWSFLAPERPEAVSHSLTSLAESLAPAGISLRLDGPWPAYAHARAIWAEAAACA